MLRVQQYERLMKTVLANHQLTGTFEGLESERPERLAKVSFQTLGNLVKEFFESFLVPEGVEKNLAWEAQAPRDRVSMTVSVRVVLSQSHWEETKKGIEELVAIRNDLVHHFIERFDVWTVEGCAAAVLHLERSYERIDAHFLQLRELAKMTESTRESFAALAQTPAFNDLLLNALSPNVNAD